MLQGFGIAKGALIQQLLKDTAVVETELYLRDQFVRNVNRKAAPFDAPVKDMTGVLFTRATSFAMFAHTGASPQAQRTQRGGPEAGGLFSEPLLDIGESLSFGWHGACVPYNTHACQLKNENPQSHSELRVSRQKLASASRRRSLKGWNDSVRQGDRIRRVLGLNYAAVPVTLHLISLTSRRAV